MFVPFRRNRVRRGVVLGWAKHVCVQGLGSRGPKNAQAAPKHFAASYHAVSQFDGARRNSQHTTQYVDISILGCGINQARPGYSPPKNNSLREAKLPCPRLSAAVREGETRVSRGLFHSDPEN